MTLFTNHKMYKDNIIFKGFHFHLNYAIILHYYYYYNKDYQQCVNYVDVENEYFIL